MNKQAQIFMSQNTSSYIFTWEDGSMDKEVIVGGHGASHTYPVISSHGGVPQSFRILWDFLNYAEANIVNNALVITTEDSTERRDLGLVGLLQEGSGKEIYLRVIQEAIPLPEMVIHIDQNKSSVSAQYNDLVYKLVFDAPFSPTTSGLTISLQCVLYPVSGSGTSRYFEISYDRGTTMPTRERTFTLSDVGDTRDIEKVVTRIVVVSPSRDDHFIYKGDTTDWVVNL